jgi:hypothetical protein
MKNLSLLLILIFGSIIVKAQDKVVLKSGTTIDAKIVKSTPTSVEYQQASIYGDSILTVQKTEVLVLIFENGYTELVSASKMKGQKARAPLSTYPVHKIAFDAFGFIGKEIHFQYEYLTKNGMISLRVPLGFIYNYDDETGFNYFLNKNSYFWGIEEAIYDPYHSYYRTNLNGFALHTGISPVFHVIAPARFRGYIAPGMTLGFFSNKYDIYENIYDPISQLYSNKYISSERYSSVFIGSTVMMGMNLLTTDKISLGIETGGGYGSFFGKNKNDNNTGIWRLSVLLGFNWGKRSF